MSLALLSVGQVAQAGEWKLKSINAGGTSTWPLYSDYADTDSQPPNGSMVGQQSWPAPDIEQGLIGNWYSPVVSTKRGVTLTRKEFGGGGEAIFEWDGSDGSTPSPYLYVKVTSAASGIARSYLDSDSGYVVPADSAKVTLDNGYEAIEIEGSLGTDGSTRTAEANVSTKRLFRYASNGASIVRVTLPVVSAIAVGKVLDRSGVRRDYRGGYVPVYYPSGADVGTGAGVQVNRDTRSVSIHNSTIEDSFFKSFAVPPAGTAAGTLGPFPVAPEKHERAADDSIVTDSAVSLIENFQGAQWKIDTTFQANPEGFANSGFLLTNPNCTWQIDNCGTPNMLSAVISPDGSRVNLDEAGRTLRLNSDMGSGVNGFPKSGSVSVTAVYTNDGAIAKNSFDVTWHLPFEKTADLPSEPKMEKMTQMIEPWYDGARSVPIQSPQTFSVAGGLEATGAIVGAAGGPAGVAAGIAIAKGLANAFDLDWHYAGTNVAMEFENDPAQWGLVQPSPGVPGRPENLDRPQYLSEPEGYKRFDISVWKTMRWVRDRWEADYYNDNGFNSSGHKLFRDRGHNIAFEPFYTFKENPLSGTQSPS